MSYLAAPNGGHPVPSKYRLYKKRVQQIRFNAAESCRVCMETGVAGSYVYSTRRVWPTHWYYNSTKKWTCFTAQSLMRAGRLPVAGLRHTHAVHTYITCEFCLTRLENQLSTHVMQLTSIYRRCTCRAYGKCVTITASSDSPCRFRSVAAKGQLRPTR